MRSLAKVVASGVCLIALASAGLTAGGRATAASGAGAVQAFYTPPEWVQAFGPFTHWYTDETRFIPDWAAPADADAWRDMIDSRRFDTEAFGAYWHDTSVGLVLVTGMPNRNVDVAGGSAAPADLVLDLNGDGTPDTAIILTNIRETGDRGVVRPDTVRQGQVYNVSRWYHPDDLLNRNQGEALLWRGLQGAYAGLQELPVWMAEGERHEALTASVEWLPHPDADGWVVRISLYSDDPKLRLSTIPVLWATATDGNDVIHVRLIPDDGLIASSAELPRAGLQDPYWIWGNPVDGPGAANVVEQMFPSRFRFNSSSNGFGPVSTFGGGFPRQIGPGGTGGGGTGNGPGHPGDGFPNGGGPNGGGPIGGGPNAGGPNSGGPSVGGDPSLPGPGPSSPGGRPVSVPGPGGLLFFGIAAWFIRLLHRHA